MTDDDIRIIDVRKPSSDRPIVVEGLPDVGLVGALAASHLVDELGLEEVAHVESSLLPPVMVLHKGVLSDPIRILGNGKAPILVLMSEVAIPPYFVHGLAETVVGWLVGKKVSTLISLGGIPAQNRVDIETPSVFGVANGDQARDSLTKANVEVMQEGFIAGAYALLLKNCRRNNIPAMALLAQAHLNYPDPGAAASVLQVLNNILDLKVNVGVLLQKADELRLRTRDLMRQAQKTIQGMGKMSEQEIPLMYS
ncbi:MAG: proteasome assembly chaperone family protein [Thaumarchaeota archaeon]|nr:proteasome assembly chaperone family protein [Nitrososphaerota archaeon]